MWPGNFAFGRLKPEPGPQQKMQKFLIEKIRQQAQTTWPGSYHEAKKKLRRLWQDAMDPKFKRQ
jgi:hypothetical protein